MGLMQMPTGEGHAKSRPNRQLEREQHYFFTKVSDSRQPQRNRGAAKVLAQSMGADTTVRAAFRARPRLSPKPALRRFSTSSTAVSTS